MFGQEMENAEKRRSRWWWSCCYEKLVDPTELNDFVAHINDPFGKMFDEEDDHEVLPTADISVSPLAATMTPPVAPMASPAPAPAYCPNDYWYPGQDTTLPTASSMRLSVASPMRSSVARSPQTCSPRKMF